MEFEPTEYKSPYKFFNLQKRYMGKIAETLNNNKVLLVEAGTGFGKTLANLFGTLEHSKNQIIYLSKTHHQNEQVIEELAKLNNANPLKLVTGLQMASRKRLCHIDHVAEAHHVVAINICNQYQKLQKRDPKFAACISCTDQSKKLQLPTILTISTLENLAKNKNACAYLTARSLLNDFDVITGHYNYYLNQDIKKAVGIEDSRPILILDEGHNLEEVLTNQYSFTLSHYLLNNVLKEVKGVDYQLTNLIKFYAKAFEFLVKSHGKENESVIFTGKEMFSIFESFGINKTRLLKFNKRIKQVREAINDYQKQVTGYYPNHLAIDDFSDFLDNDQILSEFGYIVYKMPKGFRIRKECLSPSLAFDDVRKNSHSIIICSGTLSPINLWQEILKLNDSNSITAKFGSLTDPRRVRVVAFGSDGLKNKLTTKYNHRISNPQIYSHYLHSIIDITLLFQSKFKGGILLFAPSYNFLDKMNLPVLIGDITCFSESQDAKKNSKLVKEYKKHIMQGRNALFAGVLGGKLSEGTDLPHNLVRMVIIIGIPYPPPKDPLIILKRNYYDKIRPGLGSDWYNALAFRKLSQAIGRGWRTSTDYSIGILLEERLTNPYSIEKLPIWIKNSMKLPKTWQEGMKIISEFAEVVKNLDKINPD